MFVKNTIDGRGKISYDRQVKYLGTFFFYGYY